MKQSINYVSILQFCLKGQTMVKLFVSYHCHFAYPILIIDRNCRRRSCYCQMCTSKSISGLESIVKCQWFAPDHCPKFGNLISLGNVEAFFFSSAVTHAHSCRSRTRRICPPTNPANLRTANALFFCRFFLLNAENYAALALPVYYQQIWRTVDKHDRFFQYLFCMEMFYTRSGVQKLTLQRLFRSAAHQLSYLQLQNSHVG